MDNKPKPITSIRIKPASHFKWIWCFLPGILGMLFVYWAEGIGYQAWILKEYHETIAICLMSIASLLYLIRAISCRKEIDLILLAMSVNFLCREIHFTGTDNAVVIVAGLVLVWVVIRKKQIWESIRVAKLFQISLVGAAFTYFFSILIARRVFSVEHLALLPNEAHMHVALEEVMENIAHLFMIFSGIFAYISIPKNRAIISDHQQIWGSEEGPSKGPAGGC